MKFGLNAVRSRLAAVSAGRWNRGLYLLLGLLLVSRLINIFAGTHRLTGDAAAYHRAAIHLLESGEFVWNGWRTMVPPLYPLFLAGIYHFTGPAPAVIRVLQAGMDVLSCYLVYLVAVRILKNPAAGLIAIAVITGHPVFFQCGNFLGTYVLFSMLMTGFVYTFLRAVDSGRLSLYITGGLLLGLATLTRSTSLLVVVPAWIYFIVRRWGKVFQETGRILLMCVVMGLTVLPWGIRNHRIHGRFIVTSSCGGWTWWAQTVRKTGKAHWYTYGLNRVTPISKKAPVRLGLVTRDMNEVQIGDVLKKEAKANLTARPQDFIFTSVASFGRTFFNLPFPKPPSLFTLGLALFTGAVLVLFLIAFISHPGKYLFFMLYGGYFASIHSLLGLGGLWYSITVLPFVFLVVADYLTIHPEIHA